MTVAEWVPARLEIPSGCDLISGLLTGRIQKVGQILVVSSAIGKSTKNNTPKNKAKNHYGKPSIVFFQSNGFSRIF